jgi:putative endonuclease
MRASEPAGEIPSVAEGAQKLSMYLEKWYYVYIMANRSKTLYTGVTGNIRQRVYEHKTGTFKGSFTSRYKLDRLVYFEKFKRVGVAIAREKQLKRWTKIKKIRLIVSMNPTWKDLAGDWFPELKPQKEKENA